MELSAADRKDCECPGSLHVDTDKFEEEESKYESVSGGRACVQYTSYMSSRSEESAELLFGQSTASTMEVFTT